MGPAAPPRIEDQWLAALQEDVRADIAAGKPLVVQVHAELCDGRAPRCDAPAAATDACCGLGGGEPAGPRRRRRFGGGAEGLIDWLSRRDSGWSAAHQMPGDALGEADAIDVRVWRRALPLPRAWARRPGMPGELAIYLVGFAWRAPAAERARAAYLGDLFRDRRRSLPPLAPGEKSLAAGGAARLVAWVGHQGMAGGADGDGGGGSSGNGGGGSGGAAARLSPDWAALKRDAGTLRKGAFAIAPDAAAALRVELPAATRVPLLLTWGGAPASGRTLHAGPLAAPPPSAAALERAVMAFASGGDLAAIRAAGAAGQAADLRGPGAAARALFTNPSDRRW